jgi:hypothetical protein
MRADPNMEPRAVERQAVAMPSTTKYCETHEACGGDSVGSTWGRHPQLSEQGGELKKSRARSTQAAAKRSGGRV